MRDRVTYFVEKIFFYPNLATKLISFLLLPISLLYASIMTLRRVLAKKKSFCIPIVSIGNLVVGGSGKTPFIISLAKELKISPIYIVSRGYGRRSRGLVEVSHPNRGILCSVEDSGDEPMLIAKSLPNCGVIVSEDRKEAISKAIENGAKLILLDDGFNRVDIKKFEILLEPKDVPNRLPLPSGPFRESIFSYRYADIFLKEARGYNRIVKCLFCKDKMLLATAIASPKRLDKYLPKGVIAKIYKADHSSFTEEKLSEALDRYGADSILMTQKDRVKLKDTNLPISILDLEIEIDKNVIDKIDKYIKDFYEKETSDCTDAT